MAYCTKNWTMEFTVEIVTTDGINQHTITEAEKHTKHLYDFVDSWCLKQDLQPRDYCLMRNKYVLASDATFDTVAVDGNKLVCCILPFPRPIKAHEQLYNRMPMSLQSVKDLAQIMSYLVLHHNNIFACNKVKEISEGMLLSIIEVEAEVGHAVYANMTLLDRMQEITKVAKQKLGSAYDYILTEIANELPILPIHTDSDAAL